MKRAGAILAALALLSLGGPVGVAIADAPRLDAEASPEPVDCMGPPCDEINLVCQIVFRRPCLG